MYNYSTLAGNMKRGILRFSEAICKGLARPEFKFVFQMIYGMLCAQSCHLSKIARALGEQAALKKTIERLSRHLSGLGRRMEVFDAYVRKAKVCTTDRTVLIVDGGDIMKPCSRKLEGLGRVRDGSTGEIGVGYHTIAVTALTPEQKAPICVYTGVYSASEEGFVSEDEETLKALRFLRGHFKRGNVRAFDRGYDANIYYGELIDHGEKFVIRAKKNRDVIHDGKRINIMALAGRYKGRYSLKFRKKNGAKADCKISVVPVRLPCRPDEGLNLVVCRGLGQEPMLLMTNLNSEDDRIALTVTKVYLLRWRIEEFYGFKKQQFAFEDFRVRSLNSIRCLDMLLTIAIGYVGMMSERTDESPATMELIHISKRIHGIPKFKFYAIADGIFAVFAKCRAGISQMLRKKPKPMQLSLFPIDGFLCIA